MRYSPSGRRACSAICDSWGQFARPCPHERRGKGDTGNGKGGNLGWQRGVGKWGEDSSADARAAVHRNTARAWPMLGTRRPTTSKQHPWRLAPCGRSATWMLGHVDRGAAGSVEVTIGSGARANYWPNVFFPEHSGRLEGQGRQGRRSKGHMMEYLGKKAVYFHPTDLGARSSPCCQPFHVMNIATWLPPRLRSLPQAVMW